MTKWGYKRFAISSVVSLLHVCKFKIFKFRLVTFIIMKQKVNVILVINKKNSMMLFYCNAFLARLISDNVTFVKSLLSTAEGIKGYDSCKYSFASSRSINVMMSVIISKTALKVHEN